MSIERTVMAPQPPSPQSLQDAEYWFARLAAPDCSAADRQAFERWRALPDHADAFAATEHLCRSLRQLGGRPEAELLMAEVLADTASRADRLRSNGRTLALAASLAVALIGAALYTAFGHYIASETYVTKAGQRSILRLDDGSQLILNAATRIDVKMGRSQRHFTLHRGEALFTVAADPSRPFMVSTGDGEVTALGTRFIVRRDLQRTVITLLEGRVAVDRGGPEQHVQLNPGDQVRFDATAARMSRRTVDPDLAASWTTGRLKFRSTPLAEVVEEVNRYSKTRIRLGDAALAATPVSGTFDLGDRDSMVAALQALLPIDVELQDRGEIVLVAR